MRTHRSGSLWTILTLVFLGCGKKDESPQMASLPPGAGEPDKCLTTSDSSSPKGPDKRKATAPASKPSALTVEAYRTEWKENLGAASAKYTGKVIELTGAIQWI